MTRVVVVGHGMVGGRLVAELLARDADRRLRITVLGAEPVPAYNRLLLSDVVAGRAEEAALALADSAALAEDGVDVALGTTVTALDRAARTATTADGVVHPYDALVLATGSEPVVPPVPGLDPAPAGVTAFRTAQDCRAIVAAATPGARAVVLGGGLLGVEAARGLARRGVDVALVHAGPHLLERQLDRGAGAVLARALGSLGTRVVTGARTTAVETAGGRVRALLLGDGTRLPADLLVLACGVRPSTALARAAGLDVGRGVRVDEALATSDPAVFAVGDCSEVAGAVPGTVAPGWEQARVLADRLTGSDPSARYRPAPGVVRLKAADVDVTAMGRLVPDAFDAADGTDVLTLADPAAGRYVAVAVEDDRVVGACCVGAPQAAAALVLLHDRRTPVPAQRAALLLPERVAGAALAQDDPTRLPDRAQVCRCNGVTKGAVVGAWADGARDVDGVAARTRATTGCGTCRDAVCGLLDWLAASDGAAVPHSPVPPAPVHASPGGLR